MDNKIVLMVIVAISLGMLVANMFKDVCGCKNLIEGQICEYGQDCVFDRVGGEQSSNCANYHFTDPRLRYGGQSVALPDFPANTPDFGSRTDTEFSMLDTWCGSNCAPDGDPIAGQLATHCEACCIQPSRTLTVDDNGCVVPQ